MNPSLPVPPHERHSLRVFAFDITAPDLARMRNPDILLDQTSADRIAPLLGLVTLDPDHVEMFHTDDIEAIGLATYLIDRNAVEESQIAADRARLDAHRGGVITLRAQAIPGPLTLTLDPRLTLIGTYAEQTAPVHFEPLPGGTATRDQKPAKAPMSNARISGMVATAVLLVMFALVAVFVWLAG